MLPLNQLPASAQALAAVIGEHPALKLIQRLPGRSFEIPTHVKRLSWEVVEMIGPTAAEKLCRTYNGSTLYLPKCAKAARQVQYAIIQQRFTIATTQAHVPARRAVDSLVAETGFSDRQIWRILKQPLPADLIPAPRRDNSQLALIL